MTANAVTINTSNFSSDLLPMVSQWIPAIMDRWTGNYSKIFEVRNTNQLVDILHHRAGMGLASIKEEGGRIAGDSIAQFYRDEIRLVRYGKKFAITLEAQRHMNSLKLAQDSTTEAVEKMEITKEILAFRLLNNATSTSVIPAYGDGKALCVSDHPNAVGGTYSNVLTTPGVLSEEVLETAHINISQIADNAGLIGMLRPEKLICNVAEVHNANRILGSELRAGTADNDLNSLRNMGLFNEGSRIFTPYLTDTKTFFILTNAKNGLIHTKGSGVELDSWTDKETKSAMFSVVEQYGFGCGEKRHVYMINGA